MNNIICSLFKFEVPKVSSISLAISSLFSNIEFGFRTTLNSDETRPFLASKLGNFSRVTQAIHFDFGLFSQMKENTQRVSQRSNAMCIMCIIMHNYAHERPLIA